MVEINWTPRSLDDLENIAIYISKGSHKYARLTIYRLFNAVDVLIDTPRIGRIVPEFKDSSIRELIRGNYRIVYRIISSKKIDVLTVHHSARHLSAESIF